MSNENSADELTVSVTTPLAYDINVTVTAPGNSAGVTLNDIFTVSAGVVHNLILDSRLRLTGIGLTTQTVRVVASDVVSVYSVNRRAFTGDGFIVYPIDVLGKEYYTVSFTQTYHSNSQLAIVATEDATTVTIRLSGTYYREFGDSRQAWGSYTVNMNKYDTYQLQNSGDLSGTRVTSNQPISVFSGNDRSEVGSGPTKDHMVSQILPVQSLADYYLTVPTPHRTTGDVIKAVSSLYYTTVTGQCRDTTGQNTTYTLYLMYPGSAKEQVIGSDMFCSWTGDKPFSISQFVMSQQTTNEKSDPSMCFIPAVAQFRAQYMFTTAPRHGSPYTSYFMFAVLSADKGGLLIDGNSLPNTTELFYIGNSEYVGGFVPIIDGFHNITHVNPIKTFLGIAYGVADFESYMFAVGSRVTPINTVST